MKAQVVAHRPKTDTRSRGRKALGVVRFCVHGLSGKTAAKGFTPAKIIESLKRGLPVQELEDLQASLDVPMEKLAPKLGISKATLHRRKAQGRLAQEESDRVVRFARLMGKALGGIRES